jgi:hypothetical protein
MSKKPGSRRARRPAANIALHGCYGRLLVALLVGIAVALVIVPGAAAATVPNLTINSDVVNPSDPNGQILSVTYNAGTGLNFFNWGMGGGPYTVSNVYVIIGSGTPNTTLCVPSNGPTSFGVSCTFGTPGLPAGTTFLVYAHSNPAEATGSANGWSAGDSSGTGLGTFIGPTVTGPQATTTTLTVSPNRSTFGQTVVLDATVSPAVSSGTVQFRDGSVSLGSEPLNTSGVATLPVTNFTVGPHSLTACYTGTSSFAPSMSPVVPLVVNPVNPAPPTSAVIAIAPALDGLTALVQRPLGLQVLAAYDSTIGSPAGATAATAPTTFSITSPLAGFTASPPSFSVPALAPGAADKVNFTITVPAPNVLGTVTTVPFQIAVAGSTNADQINVFVPRASVDPRIVAKLPGRFASDARGSSKRHTGPALTGKFTPEPASAHNNLAPGVADPNEVVKVQVALVQANHATEIVESPHAQATASRGSAGGPSTTCIDYLGGKRFAREKVRNGVCTGLHWLNATIETGTNKWFYAFDRAHPLPPGKWVVYGRALTRAGLGDPEIRDKFNSPLPYKKVIACGPTNC